MRKQCADHVHGVQCAAAPVHVSRAAADGAAEAVRNMQRGSGTGQRSGRRSGRRFDASHFLRSLHRPDLRLVL